LSGLPVVGDARRELAAALAEGRVIAVPGDGGYSLAFRISAGDAEAIVQARAASPAEGASLQMVVGRQVDAMALSPEWSREATQLTDRMWPGPLTVLVPAQHAASSLDRAEVSVVSIAMPTSRRLRALLVESGPLVVVALRHPDGRSIVTPEEVAARHAGNDIAIVVDGGRCDGPAPTVVDCTVSPPVVRHVGALPESYVDAALLMANRRRGWFSQRKRGDGGA